MNYSTDLLDRLSSISAEILDHTRALHSLSAEQELLLRQLGPVMSQELDSAAEPDWLTVAEAAKRLRSNRNRVYDLLRCGEISSIKHGGKRFVLPSSIDAYRDRLAAEAVTTPTGVHG